MLERLRRSTLRLRQKEWRRRHLQRRWPLVNQQSSDLLAQPNRIPGLRLLKIRRQSQRATDHQRLPGVPEEEEDSAASMEERMGAAVAAHATGSPAELEALVRGAGVAPSNK